MKRAAATREPRIADGGDLMRPEKAGANAALAPAGPKNVRWQIAVTVPSIAQRNLLARLAAALFFLHNPPELSLPHRKRLSRPPLFSATHSSPPRPR